MQFKLIALATVSIITSLAIAGPAHFARQDDPLCTDSYVSLCCVSFDGDLGIKCSPFDTDSDDDCNGTTACCDELSGNVGVGCVPIGSDDGDRTQ